ncbi:uncharacterized protein LOC126786976 [Argentina anserina]|uniref:uncharacterized protein LOC126786976 n=1 Tax=Argentina anserina TaxID=57926 RepID=UPI002176316E|nr:uncharacterized protein LOC126786976 [Potentilla anserina]
MDEERQAQSCYYNAKKKKFTHFECWEVVKDHPSFVAVLPTTPSPYASSYHGTPSATESSPTINLDDDQLNETPQSNTATPSSPPRPMGTKAAKEARRQKKHGKTPIEQRVEVLHTIASDQASWHTKRLAHNESELNYYAEYIDIQKRKEARAEEELRLKKQENDTRIMTMDLEAMTPISKRYFTKRKLAILNEGEASQDQPTDETYSDCYHPNRMLFP